MQRKAGTIFPEKANVSAPKKERWKCNLNCEYLFCEMWIFFSLKSIFGILKKVKR
ncbi:hypothetical protein FEM08_16200 [Flavobacterium gilvum]|nr:hypothetical protein FEM08_16200 [Flavobacterium gilvum]